MRWIVGDVHGMLAPLHTLIEAVRARDWNPHFIFVGDYVNRGPDSRGVIDLLRSLPDASFVRGNHDDIFDLVLHGDCYVSHETGPDAMAAFKWFSNHGLMNTLESYGLDHAEVESVVNRTTPERLQTLLSVVPGTHRAFLRGLRPMVEYDDLFVVHAMWDINAPDDFSTLSANVRTRHRLLWGRYRGDEIRTPKRWRRTGYFGHTPVLNYGVTEVVPMHGPHIVMLDTGAALGPSGRLSAVCAESGALVQSRRDGTLVEAE